MKSFSLYSLITPATGKAREDSVAASWRKCMIAIDHPIDNEPLLKFHTAVLGEKKKPSILEVFYVGGLIDSVIIILSLQIIT